MAEYRLKIKIGDHEFDAEGPVEDVKAQFEAFKQLVAAAPVKAESPRQEKNGKVNGNGDDAGQLNLEKIMRAKGRMVSLTIKPGSAREATLLVLLGQRSLLANEAVTGGQILDGLRESGYTKLERIDRTIQPLADAGDIIIIGFHRSRTYRLTNQGLSKAQGVASELISMVP